MNLIELQTELEKRGVEDGIARYRQQRERMDGAQLPPGKYMLARVIYPVSEAIKAWVLKSESRPGVRVSLLDRVKTLDPDVAALIVSRAAISMIGGGRSSYASRLQAVAVMVGEDFYHEFMMNAFKAGAPKAYRFMEADLKKKYVSSRDKRRFVARLAMGRAKVRAEEWSKPEIYKLGVLLLGIFKDSTGLIEYVTMGKGRAKWVSVKATAEAAEWFDDKHAASELMFPVHRAMVVTPRPWSTPFDGGYLTHRKPLVRTFNRDYLKELQQVDMPQVYAAVNALQETPWRINTAVLDVLRRVWEEGADVGVVPPRDRLPIPAAPMAIEKAKEERTEEEKQEVQAWKRRAALVHEANNRMVSKRISFIAKIRIADEYAKLDTALYFPHSLDWRGRAYPIPPVLNPQGDDVARALLKFDAGVPLGETGAYWLAVHIANLFGVDKVSFDDRVAWVEDNAGRILDSAANPLDGDRFWTTADSPWQALAACFEFAGYTLQGDSYVSHLPVALDGSCNGLQNFSAMLRDEVGGAVVNLIPADKPSDIYTTVAEAVKAAVDKDASEGNDEAVYWLGKVKRSIVKRQVMTTPYGVTYVGMRDQLIAELTKDTNGLPDGDLMPHANYLTGHIRDAIGSTVRAAREAMDWLQAVARVVARNDLPVKWTAPSGFYAVQAYRVPIIKRIKTWGATSRMEVPMFMEEGTKLDRRRQATGIAPNFVHSLDAAHMMLTVNAAQEAGIVDFAMVHDSYGTHAGNIGALATVLRKVFVRMYSANVLREFVDELCAGLPQNLAAEIPPPPAMGTLDIEQVLNAPYFFS